jgi:glutaminase
VRLSGVPRGAAEEQLGQRIVEFAIMSVAKPFVFALACTALGPEELRRRIGVNATGLPFNS